MAGRTPGILCSALLLFAAGAPAETLSAVWQGGAAGAWSDASWSGLAGADSFPNNSPAANYIAAVVSASLALDPATPDLALDGLVLGSAARLTLSTGTRSIDLLSGAVPNAPGGTLANAGTIEIAGGSLTLRNAVIGNTGGTLLASGGALTLEEVDVNGGTIQTGAGGLTIAGFTFLNGVALVNQGTAEVTGFVLNCCGSISNSGTFTVRSGAEMYLAGGVGNSGTFALESSANLILAGDTTFSGSGTLSLDGATLQGSTGTERLINQSVVSGAGQVLADLTNQGTIAARGGNLYLGGAVNNAGVLQVDAGARMELFDLVQYSPGLGLGPGTLTAGTYQVAGTLQLDFASITANQALLTLSGAGARVENGSGGDALAALAANHAGGVLHLADGATFTASQDFANQGTIETSGGGAFLTSYSLDSRGGTIRIADAASRVTVGGAFGSVPGGVLTDTALDLAGTLRYDVGDDIQTIGAGSRLELRGAGAVVDAGGRNRLAGLGLNQGGALVIGAGAALALAGEYRQTGGETRVDGALQAANVVVEQGVFSGDGSLQGDLRIAEGGIFEVSIDALLGIHDSFDVNGSVTLDGLIRVLLEGAPAAGSRFEWLTFSGLLSGGWTYDLPELAEGLQWLQVRGDGYLALEVSNVPEPASWLLALGALTTVGALRRRRARLI